MVTTRISVAPHLAEYIEGKYGSFSDGPVRLPDSSDLYHVIWDLLEKRPKTAGADSGNLELVLPERSCGKRPENYNYLGVRSQQIISQKMELMMWADAHSFIDEQKHEQGIDYKDSVIRFRLKYGIESLSEDAFIKNYYRWREKVRQKEKKREYSRR